MSGLLDWVHKVGRQTAETTTSVVETTATVAASFVATIRKDWPAMIQILDSKIANTQAELVAAEEQRRTLAFDAHATDGETKSGAATRLKAANAECERLQRTIADLRAARAEAVKRQNTDEAEAERAAEAEKRREAIAAHRKMLTAVRNAEKALDDAAAALAVAQDAKNEFCRVRPPSHSGDVVFAAWGTLPHCINFKLRGFGLRPPMFMSADQAHWERYFPDLARLGLEDGAKD
jgi:hypothetical protein